MIRTSGGNYPDADGDFSNAPYFNFNDGKVKLGTNWVDNPNDFCGSASGFLPKSLHDLQGAFIFVIVAKDKLYLENLIAPIRSFLSDKLALELHPKKITIHKFHQGIDFLGYIALPHHRFLRTKTKQRILRKLHKRVSEYKSSIITKRILEQSLQSYLGVLSHANTYKFSNGLKNQFWFWLNG